MLLKKVSLFSGVGESIQDLWFLSKPTDLQHHQGGSAVCVLCCHDRVAGIQTQTVQDQVQMRAGAGGAQCILEWPNRETTVKCCYEEVVPCLSVPISVRMNTRVVNKIYAMFILLGKRGN